MAGFIMNYYVSALFCYRLRGQHQLYDTVFKICTLCNSSCFWHFLTFKCLYFLFGSVKINEVQFFA